MRRGQLSLTVAEAGVGVLLVLAVSSGFVLGVPSPESRESQLDAYARDATTVLANEAPRHGASTRLVEVARSEEAFAREGAALEHRVDRLLPDNLLFRIRTPHGDLGYRKPAGVPVGTARVTTAGGDVIIWVWYS